ncbi:MAG: hypothetical protein WCO18_01550, partial [bacterium]
MFSKKFQNINYSGQNEAEIPDVGKEIAFTDEFRDIVSQEGNKGLMLEIKKAIDQPNIVSLKDGEVIETERAEIEFLGRHREYEGKHKRCYFRVKMKDGSGDLFVRVNHDPRSSYEDGAPEVVELSKLSERLKQFSEFKVRTPEYVLGYKDREATYLVSKYEPALEETIQDRLEKIKNKANAASLGEKKEAEEISERVKTLRRFE